jgi:Lhr-like helicase
MAMHILGDEITQLRAALATAESERDAARETITHYQADVANNYKLMSLYQDQRDMWIQEAERLQNERAQLRIRVWNRTLNACGGETAADYVAAAFDEPMAAPGTPLARAAMDGKP